jgi:hypothetical protein
MVRFVVFHLLSYIQYIHTYTHTHIHTYIHILSLSILWIDFDLILLTHSRSNIFSDPQYLDLIDNYGYLNLGKFISSLSLPLSLSLSSFLFIHLMFLITFNRYCMDILPTSKHWMFERSVLASRQGHNQKIKERFSHSFQHLTIYENLIISESYIYSNGK